MLWFAGMLGLLAVGSITLVVEMADDGDETIRSDATLAYGGPGDPGTSDIAGLILPGDDQANTITDSEGDV